jgi:hypothetical protein
MGIGERGGKYYWSKSQCIYGHGFPGIHLVDIRNKPTISQIKLRQVRTRQQRDRAVAQTLPSQGRCSS